MAFCFIRSIKFALICSIRWRLIGLAGLGLEYRGMHNAHARKVFVMHITDAYSNESEESMASSFTRRTCAFVFALLAFTVFGGIYLLKEEYRTLTS
jgi:hypothetical protein